MRRTDGLPRRLWLRVLALGLGTLGVLTAAPALAADAANTAVRGVGSAPGSGCCGQGFAGYSLQLGGYGPALSVSETTTFVVPKLRCGRADRAIAPSAGAFVGKDNRPSIATLFVGCDGGQAHYWPVLAVNGRFKNYRTKAAHAGDTIVLRLNTQRGGHVSVADQTRRFEVSRISPRGDSVSVAWIGDEGWINSEDHLEGVPHFGTLTYSNTKVYGRPLDHLPPDGFSSAENRTSAAGTLQINTAPLFSRGNAFRTYFRHS